MLEGSSLCREDAYIRKILTAETTWRRAHSWQSTHTRNTVHGIHYTYLYYECKYNDTYLCVTLLDGQFTLGDTLQLLPLLQQHPHLLHALWGVCVCARASA